MIEVLSSGALNLVQDAGRKGHLGIGVSRGGAMDLQALALANVLAGNDVGAAAIEISIFPFRLRFKTDCNFACTGAVCPIELDNHAIPPWWTITARAGQTLVLGAPTRGARAYVAVQGGIDVPVVLDSRATDLKAGFGGLEGRALKRGDLLAIGPHESKTHMDSGIGVVPATMPDFVRELATSEVRIRVLAGAEYERFAPEARRAFTETSYLITNEANRMGYRLSGTQLALSEPLELLSHGIVPGTIQVPPAGQPIVQMADANTCGGYPKIANVISADLWRLAQTPIGTRLRFAIVSIQEAANALRIQQRELHDIRLNLSYMRSRG